MNSTLQGTKSIFERVYICLAACRILFLQRCMPVFDFDGYHIKEQQHSLQAMKTTFIESTKPIHKKNYELQVKSFNKQAAHL